MKILIYTPLHPVYGIRRNTWENVNVGRRITKHQATWHIESDRQLHEHPYQNITESYNRARDMVLGAGDYDALLTVEADMIPPTDFIDKLADVDADVAYGLYVFRQGKQWSAYPKLGLFSARSISEDQEAAKMAWGKTIEVGGLGLGCTFIRRKVLEVVQFRLYEGKKGDWLIDKYEKIAEKVAERTNIKIDLERPRYTMMANDWLFGLDVQHHGFKQACDTSVVCGHVDDTAVLWPDPAADKLYTSVPVTHI